MRLPPLAFLSLLLTACSGNHDQLALRPQPSQDAGHDHFDAGAGEDASLDDEPDAADFPDASPEPPRPFALTFVNGMPDAPAIRLCFVPVVEGEERIEDAVLFPEGAEGLAYGRSKVGSTLEAIDWAASAFRPYVLAGDALAEVTSCSEALMEAGEDLVATPLPVLPAFGVTEGRSVLLVTTGCALHDGEAESICRNAPFSETGAGMVVVPLARKPLGQGIGLQAVHAFASSATIAVEIAPALDLPAFTVANAITPGAIAPHPAPHAHEASRFGPVPRDASIVVRDSSSSSQIAAFGLGSAMANGGIETTAFVEGESYALVVLGPSPSAQLPSGFQPSAAVLVKGEPVQ